MITIVSAGYCFASSRPQLHEAWGLLLSSSCMGGNWGTGKLRFCNVPWVMEQGVCRPETPPQPPVWKSRFFLPGEGAFSTFLDEKHKHHQRQKNKGTRKEKLKSRKHEKRWEETKLKMCHNQQNWIYLPN